MSLNRSTPEGWLEETGELSRSTPFGWVEESQTSGPVDATASGGTGTGTGSGSGGDASSSQNGDASGGTGSGTGSGSGGTAEGIWGVLAETIAAETATGDHGPGILYDEAINPANAGKYLRAVLTGEIPGSVDIAPNGAILGFDLPIGVRVITYDVYVNNVFASSSSFTVTVTSGEAVATGGTGTSAGSGSGGEAIGQVSADAEGGTGTGTGAGTGGDASATAHSTLTGYSTERKYVVPVESRAFFVNP